MVDLRFCVIGLGSMGKRRVRNLQALGYSAIIGVDRRADRRNETVERYGISVSDNVDHALNQADIVIISLPPDLHAEYALRAVSAGKSVFCEASVTDDGLDELAASAAAAGVIVFPSCTMRYFPAPRAIRSLLDDGAIGKPLFLTHHAGQYLPDWHPWEKITDYYVSNPRTGGCREIVPFELAWLTWMFGDVVETRGWVGRLGDLGIALDDCYQGLIAFASGVHCALTVDVLARPAVRATRIVGERGTIRWDDAGVAWSADGGAWQTVELERGTPEHGYINPEEPYQREMIDFIASAQSRTVPAYDLAADRRVLSALYAIETSAQRSGAAVRPERCLPGSGARQ